MSRVPSWRRAIRVLSGALPVALVVALTGLPGTGAVASAAGTSAGAPAATGSGTTLYAHDADGRVTAVFDGSGAGSKITYDKDGNITAVTAMPAATLAVVQVSPQSAAAGAAVTIYGTDLGSSPSVTIGGAAATVQSAAANEIVATVPSGASGSGVSVTVAGTKVTGTFTVIGAPPKPTVTGLSEQVGNPGGTMTVTGTGFSTSAASDVASVNGTKVGVTSATSTSLQVELPPLGVAGPLTVTTPGGTATSSAQIVTPPPPYLAANVGFAGGLANGTQTNITLSSANQIALATFSVSAGQRASVTVNASITDPFGEDNEYTIDIYGPGGRLMVQDPDGGIVYNPQTWYLPDGAPSGTYEIVLIPVNGDTGSFQVTASDITDPSASLTVGGAAVPIDVTVAGERPRWTFTGTAGQSVYVQWSPLCGCTTQLLGPDGNPVGFDEGSDAFLTAQLPSAGTYTLVIDADGSLFQNTGTYTAQVSAIPADATGSTTVGGTAGSVTITEPGQDGDVTFSGTAGQQVFTQASFGTAPEGGGVAVFGPDGSLVGQATWDGGSTIAVDTITLPSTGTYKVKLSQLTELDETTFDEVGYTGSASVAVTSAPNVTATTTVDGTAASLSMTKPGQHGIVTFTGTAGEKVFTGLTMSPAESTTGTVTLLAEPAGTVVGSSSLTGSSGFIDTVTLPATGSYEVLVDPVDPTGGYTGTIKVAVNSAPDQTGTTSVNGTAASVTLAKPGEQAIVSFPGTAGQDVFTQIAFTGTPTQCGSGELQDTASGLVNFANCFDSAPVYIDDSTLPDTATYQVLVTPSGGYTGTVTVTLTAVPAPATATGTYGGAAVKVSTTKPGQDAVITYTGVPASTSAEVNVTASTFPADDEPTGLLNDPNDDLVAYCLNLIGSPACTGTTTTAGSYALDVDHFGPYTGSVTVQLTTDSGDDAASPFQPSVSLPPALAKGNRTAHPPVIAPKAHVAKRPRPGSAMAGTWRPARRSGMPLWSWTGATRPLPAASLTGRIVTTSGAPLAGVTVSVGRRHSRTGGSGLFRLTGLPQGMAVLEMDGRTASTARRTFGVFDVQVQLRAGANRLPFTSYFPVLDTAHEVSVTEPLARNVTLTTPAIPGLAVHLPKGALITDADGKPVYKLGITAIPVRRTPIPMPVDEQVPVYFTVQPAGGHISDGWATIDYPNYHHAAPGTTVNFWHYALHGAGWDIYGTGTVNKAGTQVIPARGTWVNDFNGAMINVSGYPDPGASWLAKFLNFAGDPVDPSTGLYHMTQTDLTVNDVMPLTMTRGYNPADGNPREFGNNSSDIYDTFLTHDQQEPLLYTEADLNLIDGGKVHFTRISPGTSFAGAVMEAQSTSPQFFGAILAWNGEGWNLTLRDGTTLVYGENAPLQEIRDAHGNTVRIIRLYQNSFGNYDGPITQVISPNGYWLAFTWDNYDNPAMITKVTDNAGRSVSYTYDTEGNLQTVTDPDGHVTTYGYDSSNRLTTIKDANGTTYLTNTYNSSNQLTSQAIAGQGTYAFTYTSPTAVKVTDPDGTVRDLGYDSNGYLSSDQRAAGTSSAHTIAVTPVTTDATGELPGSVSDGMGRTVSTVYDASGDELTNTYKSGTSSVSSSATYNGTPFGLPDSVTSPDGHTEHFTYDSGGDPTSVTDALGNKGTAAYNGQGNQTSMASPLGNSTSSIYTSGLLTSSTDPLGRTTRYVHDQAGRLVQTVAPDGATTSTGYDADNQVTSTTDADGYTTTYAYDGNGNLTKVTDPIGNVTKYAYNNADQLTSVTDALNHVTTYTYNAAGEMTSAVDPDGHKTVYTYDPLGRLTFTGYGATTSGTYQSTLTYTYNATTGNLATVADSTAGSGTVTYTYDALDHITSQAGPGGTVSYAYNSAGQMTSMTPPGQSAITYTYSATDQLTKEVQGSQTATFSYDADGRLTGQTLPDGITATYTYDKAAELTGITYKSGSTTVGTVTYAYNADGWRISEGGTLVHTILPAAQSGSSYNADNELTSFGGKTYSYDADGNLLSDGTNTYTWNDRGQLATVTTGSATSTLGYDPLGRLISTAVGGITTTFAYQGTQLVSQTAGSATTAFLNSPYGTLSSTSGSAVQAYLPDALGSTLALVNSAGQVTTSYSYNVFGAATSSAGTGDPNPVRYTGLISGAAMPAGLQDNNARDYSSATGRFISADPTGAAGSGDNLYQYAGDDTADNSDPSGLQWQLLAGCAIGAGLNDIGGALDGRKHSLGDFLGGAGLGCLGGALMTIGAGEALDALEAGGTAFAGVDGSEDLTLLEDDLYGDGTAESCGGQSFSASTKVLTASGRHVAISKLTTGRKVIATNPKTGKTAAAVISAVLVHHDTNLYDLQVRSRRHSAIIGTTGNHLFWDATKHAWVKAALLRRGDHLRTVGGAVVTVVRGWIPSHHDGRMWDLTVAKVHAFYVVAGTAGLVLVHNAGGPDPCATGQAGETAAGITKNTRKIWINGQWRIPDELNATTIGEVKNVGYQYLSTQIKEYLSYAQANGLTFKLYVRVSTRLSAALQELVDSGQIQLIRTLP